VTELDNTLDLLLVTHEDVVVHVRASDIFTFGFEHEVTVTNLKDVIPVSALGKVEGAPYFASYQEYEDIHAYYKSLCEANPDILSYEVVGQSIQGRDIIAVKLVIFCFSLSFPYHLPNSPLTPLFALKSSKSKGPSDKLQHYFQSLTHAREWLTGATLTYVFDKFVAQYGIDAEITRLIDEYELIFVPVVNPDGYKFSWTNDRTWRKNRRINAGSSAIGVDLNRNWNTTVWGDSPTNPSSDSYQGTAPKSEPEVLTLSDYFMSLGNVVSAMDFHTYGQLGRTKK
jgi:murein tripeptide amidase MpaA